MAYSLRQRPTGKHMSNLCIRFQKRKSRQLVRASGKGREGKARQEDHPNLTIFGRSAFSFPLVAASIITCRSSFMPFASQL